VIAAGPDQVEELKEIENSFLGWVRLRLVNRLSKLLTLKMTTKLGNNKKGKKGW
jgi:hypothetical protein